MRLDRLLANLGYGSRREVSAYLKRGLLTRDDGNPVGTNENVPIEELRFNGEPLDPPSPLTIVMNKPLGHVCTTSQDEGQTVYDLLPPRFSQRKPILATVGRLDKETSGLLLFTDDGSLLHRLISPKKEVWKTYEASLARPIDEEQCAQLTDGTLTLSEETKPCLPARITILDPQRIRISITEGRYHQVRRMLAAVGNHVESLTRVAIGELALSEDLPEGEWRILSTEELPLLTS